MEEFIVFLNVWVDFTLFLQCKQALNNIYEVSTKY